ncbi:MAG: hypothetical protein M3P34_09720 [Actinomycetota bacterium]|nr:hypothetical protein [Actinomycetota bacterium]
MTEAEPLAEPDDDEADPVGRVRHPQRRGLLAPRRRRVDVVADVRRYPGSRRHPHFASTELAG